MAFPDIPDKMKAKLDDFLSQSATDKMYDAIILMWILACTIGAVSHFVYYLGLCRSSYEIYIQGAFLPTAYLIFLETLLVWVFLMVIPITLVQVIRGLVGRITTHFKKKAGPE